MGSEIPLFVSPASSVCLTGGAWSPTRPAVLFVTAADGHMHAWDFTDSSYRASVDLHVTHTKVTSMEFLISGNPSPAAATAASVAAATQVTVRQQLLAIGDETGTLHIFEIPRNLARPVHKEDKIMGAFLEREYNFKVNTLCNDVKVKGKYYVLIFYFTLLYFTLYSVCKLLKWILLLMRMLMLVM